MKEKIQKIITVLKADLKDYADGEHYSDYDYTKGSIDAYKAVLKLIEKEEKTASAK